MLNFCGEVLQEASTAPAFKPMNKGKETKPQSGTAQVRQTPSATTIHLQEPALPAKGSDRVGRGQGLRRGALAEDKTRAAQEIL